MTVALPAGTSRVTMQARVVFGLSVVGTLALYASPWAYSVGYPLMLLSTLAHELGHGFAALMVGGEFNSFRMWADGSGVANWSGQAGPFRQAFVSAGGLVGPAVAAMLFLLFGRRARGARLCLALVGAGLLAIEILLVRNVFGLIFIGLIALIALGIALKAPDGVAQAALVFVAVQLALSVYSRGDYLFTDVAETSGGTMPSDVAQMANALFLPYWFWGALCGAFSVAVLIFGSWRFLRR